MRERQARIRRWQWIWNACVLIGWAAVAFGQEMYMHRNADGSVTFSNAPTAQGYEEHAPPGRGPSHMGSTVGSTASLPGNDAAQQAESAKRRAAAQEKQQAAAAARVDELVATVQGSRSRERWEAIQALGSMGPRAAKAVPALVKIAGDDDKSTRNVAVVALAEIAPDDFAVIRTVVDALKDADTVVRANAVSFSSRLGPAAVPVLLRAMTDPDPRMRAGAAQALGSASRAHSDATLADQTIETLGQALNDHDPAVRKAAAAALGSFGRRARPAVPALAMLLSDKDTYAAGAAAQTLGAIGPDAADAVPRLAKAMYGDYHVSTNARAALQSIGTADARQALEDFERKTEPRRQ